MFGLGPATRVYVGLEALMAAGTGAERLVRGSGGGGGTSTDRAEKRACRCARGKVVSPALAPRIIEKGLVSDAMVVAMVVSKYSDHLPLYRQESMLRREAGVEISRATMTGWMMEIGELAQAVCGGMRRDLLAGGYLQADETTVAVQTHDKRGENHQAYLWQYGRPGGEVVFDFQLGRGREGPRQFLEGYRGKLQTDGYQAYDDGVGGPGMVHAGCWGHYLDSGVIRSEGAKHSGGPGPVCVA